MHPLHCRSVFVRIIGVVSEMICVVVECNCSPCGVEAAVLLSFLVVVCV